MSIEVDPKETLATWVRQYRTQREAAAVLGVHESFLSDMLSGRRDVSVPVLEQLGLRRTVVKDVA
jgi:plasmid maintenance system antidote protein VapI